MEKYGYCAKTCRQTRSVLIWHMLDCTLPEDCRTFNRGLWPFKDMTRYVHSRWLESDGTADSMGDRLEFDYTKCAGG